MAAEHFNKDSVANERDFYRRLLDLGSEDEVEPLLDAALAMIVEVASADIAYLELYDDDQTEPRFWKGHGCSDQALEVIRASISRGIVARALSEGATIETPSAQGDQRFQDLGSVRRHEIEAVLCAPVGRRPPIGVIYLQRCLRPGSFTRGDRERVELFARQLAPLAERLVARRPGRERVDHTAEIRARFHCPELVGRSARLAQVLRQAALVAPLDVDVLLTGSSGTGKSELAKIIANNSARARGPFVALNCAAMPETLIESELFGAERGAHSTATRRLVGKVGAARGGTLFLDEVGELTLGSQAKLLHLLQAREYYPLGSSTAVPADVRIISATNAHLLERVAEKRFREDLYYRLHVLPIELPDLSERREDIPKLVERFCDEACRRHRITSLMVSSRALIACREAAWPGNIRELVNVVQRAVILAHGEGARSLHEHHLFPGAQADTDATERPVTLVEEMRRFQRRLVAEALEKNDWNVAATARQLGLVRSHLYTLMESFDLRRRGNGGRERG